VPGTYEQKFDDLRAAYGYMMTHPGKKLLFMGQDFAQFAEWNEAKSLEWNLTEEYESHRQMQAYYQALNHLYTSHQALYEGDYLQEGFEWIDCMDAERSIITFLRRSKDSKEQLLVVCNFTPVTHTDYRVGVPFAGKFKEIFNSSKPEFGGNGEGNPRMKRSKPVNWNNRDNSIELTIPGLSMMVFSCEEEAPKKATAEKSAAKKPAKAAEKKTAAKKEAKATEKKTVTKKEAKATEKRTVAKKAEKVTEKKTSAKKAGKAKKEDK